MTVDANVELSGRPQRPQDTRKRARTIPYQDHRLAPRRIAYSAFYAVWLPEN